MRQSRVIPTSQGAARPGILVLLFIFLLPLRSLEAQWVRANGPYGGTVQCLASLPSASGPAALIAGTTTAGAFRSTDNGNSWQDANNGLTSRYVISLATYPAAGGTVLLAGTLDGVFQSTDGGLSWAVRNNGLTTPDSRLIFCVNGSPDGAGGTTLYAGTIAGVFRSTNTGGSWVPADSGLPVGGTLPYCLAGIPNGTGGSYVFLGCESYGMYLSPDNGVHWVVDTVGFAYTGIRGLAVSGNYVFTCTAGRGVFRISKNQSSWTPVNTGLTTQNSLVGITIAAAPNGSGGSNIFLSTLDGIYVSPDSGMRWTPLKNGITTSSALSLVGGADGAGGTSLFAGTIDQGIFRMGNRGSAWESASNGLAAAAVQTLSVSTGFPGQPTLFAGTPGGAFRSTDDGQSWSAINNGLPNAQAMSIVCLGVGPDGSGGMNLYAGTKWGIFASSNGGTGWTVSGNYPNSTIESIAVDGSNIFADGAYLSTNYGSTWKLVNSASAGPCAILPGGPSRILLYDISQVSADSGKTWNDVSNSWNTLTHGTGAWWKVTAVAVNGTDLFVGTGDGIKLSGNNGAGWSPLDNGLRDTAVYSLLAGANVYAGTDSGGVYLLTNFGTTWKPVNTGLPQDVNILSLSQTGSTLFAGSDGRGLWRRPLAEVFTSVAGGASTGVARTPVLRRNYPNPFNPSTNIEYSVPDAERVVLKVFDILGREVATLADGIVPPGNYTVTWNASGVASGVYFCRMEAGGSAQTRGMMLLK